MGIFDKITDALSGKVASTPTGESSAGPSNTQTTKIDKDFKNSAIYQDKLKAMAEKGLDYNGNPLPKQDKKQSVTKKKTVLQRMYKEMK